MTSTGPDARVGRHRHAVVVLAHRGDLVAEAEVGARLAQLLFEKPHQLPLLALHPIGVVGVAREQREVEGRDRPGLAVAELPGRRLEPDLDHSRHELEFIEQVEGRRMEGRAAKLHDELRLGCEQDRRDAAAAERQRGGQADRAGADDNDAIVFIRHRGRTFRCRRDIARWPA